MTGAKRPSSIDPNGAGIGFREAFRYWLRLGFINFGGPAGQIAMMHRDLVDRRHWISEERFLHALNYCILIALYRFKADVLWVVIGGGLIGLARALLSG